MNQCTFTSTIATLLALLVSLYVVVGLSGAQLELAPPIGSGQFGKSVSILPNGNFVVADPAYDAPGPIADVGAVHLYDGVSLQLISTLTGDSTGDRVGWSGVVILANGSFVVGSPYWKGSRGAATWIDPINGLSGVVSPTNSLVGGTSFDFVGNKILGLKDGHYLVVSPQWDNQGIQEAGAVTWGRGDGGIAGLISELNSLVGSYRFDQVGTVTLLANGNYVISSSWNESRGAVTWGDGAVGVRGRISATNSLIGNLAYDPFAGSSADLVGSGGVTALSNGNYVVASPNWTGSLLTPNSVGAVTWGNGNGGVTGKVSSANSLVGEGLNDSVGIGGVTALANGNYVVRSTEWGFGDGAVTWGDGAIGSRGVVNSINSLVGNGGDTDHVGFGGIVALPNGNYVVNTWHWSDLATGIQAGAVTWANGKTGLRGFVSVENSLVGMEFDSLGFGGITVLPNGNYVVNSYYWNGSRGAVTWCNGETGRAGFISTTNSLVGGSEGDVIGLNGIQVLANGNFVVASPNWRNGSVPGVGAVTWGSGRNGVRGVVSVLNSLVGASANDFVGWVNVLANGHYVVTSPNWDNGSMVNAGAFTWCNGEIGSTGVVSGANSLVGSVANDQIGIGHAQALANGNYVIRSPLWDNGATINVGAVTWASGSGVLTGVVSAANSLVGQSANDWVGTNEVTVLPDGNYVVRAPTWDNDGLVDAGAVTWANGSNGLTGFISAGNSLVGKVANDRIGGQRVSGLSDGGYVAFNSSGSHGAGAVTLGHARGGTTGHISSANSVLVPLSDGTNFTVTAYDSGNARLLVGAASSNRVTLIADPIRLAGRLSQRLLTFPTAYELLFGNGDIPSEHAVYARWDSGHSSLPLALVDAANGSPIVARQESAGDGVEWLFFTNLTAVTREVRVPESAWQRGARIDLALYRVVRPGGSCDGGLDPSDPSSTNRAGAVGNGLWYYDDFLLRGVQPGDRVNARVTSSTLNPFIEVRLVADESVLQYVDGPSLELNTQGVAGRARDYLIRVTSRESQAVGKYLLAVERQNLVPVIRDFAPPAGTPGTRVTVRGGNFLDGPQPLFDGVSIGEVVAPSFAPVVRGGEQEFELIVPSDARTGPIRLHRLENILAASTNVFTVLAPVGGVRWEPLDSRFSFVLTNSDGPAQFVVEATRTLDPPIRWQAIATNQVPDRAVWRYTNATSAPQQYFRARRE